jgi:hypothetical protein
MTNNRGVYLYSQFWQGCEGTKQEMTLIRVM